VIFTITTSGTSGTALAGYFTFHFYGHTTQFKADAYSPTFSNANCVTFVQALPNVETATCVVSSISSDHRGATYTITVTKYAVTPYENNFFYHEGNPLASYMGCSIDDLTAGASPVCAVAVTQQSTKEYLYCSNRGICDMDSGTCSCDLNFYGRNCENEGSIVQVDDASTALQLTAESSTYVGTLLEMKVATTATANYKFINMIANGASKFSINGVGEVTLSGITVDTTGVTATDGGASITQATNSDVFTATASQTSFTETIFVMASSKAADSDFNAMLFKAGNGGTEVFKVTGDGAITTTNAVQSTSPTTGSIKTAGGVAVGKAVYVGGIIVTASLTDSTSTTTGSIITAGGMGIAKRLTSAQLEVANSEQLSPTTAAAYFRNSHLSFAGNVLLIESSMQAGASSFNLIQANINKDLTKVLKFEVDGSGYVTAAGGANVLAGGVTVAAGGATVAAGGLTISAGSIALTSTAAQTITHTGSANNGLTISSGGGVTLSGAVIFGASGCNCASSGGLDLKNAVPMRFDGATEDNYWLNIAVGAGPTGSSKTLTLPVGETGTLLTDATTGSSVLTSVGTLTGLAVTGTTTLSTTTGVTHITNSRTSGFVGNLLQLDTAMETASNAYNIILARVDTAGTPTTKFKVDGTGKVTAAGGAVFGGTGMSLAAGDFTMTSSGAAAITHTGSGSNGLTISSGGGVTISGAVTFGSTTYGVTIGNNQPIQFDGDTVDSNYLILDVGNGPTGGSKTLTLPIDSTATVVASASTLAVTIQTSHAGGVTVESAKYVDNVITETSGSTFLSLEGVRFEDGAVSTVTTVGMTSHLTNSGGDVLLTKGSGQAITKSGGGDLIITNSVANDFVHVEDWTFKAGDITSSSHLSIDAASSTLEKFKCTENVCEHSAGDGASNFISIEVVRFYNGAISAATTIDMSSHLTNSGGDVLLTKGSGQAITKSGGGDLVITNSVANDYVQVEDWKFKAAAVESTAHMTMDGASVALERLQCTSNVCNYLNGYQSWTFSLGGDHGLTKSVGVTVTQGTLTGLLQTALTGSGTSIVITAATGQVFTNNGVDLVVDGSSTIAHASINTAGSVRWGYMYTIAISATTINEVAGVQVKQGGNVGVLRTTLSGSETSIEIVAVAGLTWVTNAAMTIDDTNVADSVINGVTVNGQADYIEIETAKFMDGAISDVTDLTMSGDLTNSGDDMLFTKGSGQAITKSGGGDLVISGSAAVCVEDWCFTAGVAASSSVHLQMDGASAAIEKFKCIDGDCVNSVGGSNYITIEDVKFLNGAVSDVSSLAMSGSLTNSAGDILMTKGGDQSITKSGSGDLLISGSAAVCVEDWCFTAGAVASSSHLTIDAASVTIEALKCISNVCENSAGAGASNWISLEVVRFLDGAISEATSLTMSADLTNSGGNLLFTGGSGQAITKSNGGDLVISSSVGAGAVIVESWKFTDGAVTGVAGSTDLSIDAASTTIENMKCIASACDHKSGAGNALVLEDVSYQDGAISAKSLTLDPNNAAGGAIVVTNTATQTSGNLVTITGRAGQNAISVPAGNVNLGNGKFVVNQNGVETFGVNVCAVAVTSATGNPNAACNSVVGTVTITVPSSGGIYPIQPGTCGDTLNLVNSKIASSNSVVVLTVTEYAGMVATQSMSAGIPYILTGAVAGGNVQIFVCNVGAQPLTGVVKVKFIVAGG